MNTVTEPSDPNPPANDDSPCREDDTYLAGTADPDSPGEADSAIEIQIDEGLESRLAEHSITAEKVIAAVRSAAAIGQCDDVRVGVRISDDATIHEINRQFLQHDYPTDVISFPYDLRPPMVEGELIVSLDTAVTEAAAAGWSVAEELLLYVIHGTLHLVGFDDTTDDARATMRSAERDAMRRVGLGI